MNTKNFKLNKEGLEMIKIIGILIFFSAGLAILCIQIFGYLKFGEWESCSIVSCWLSNVRIYLFDFYISWSGLYAILNLLPLSLSCFVITFTWVKIFE